MPLLLSPMTLKNYAVQCPERRSTSAASARAATGDYRARLYRAHELSYTDASPTSTWLYTAECIPPLLNGKIP